MRGFILVIVLICAIWGAVPQSGLAQDIDMHAVFEARCQSCHGHSGAFARDRLAVVDGQVVGSRGQSLMNFLQGHQGGLSGTEAALLLNMFRAQIDSGALFRERCLTCHDTARTFVRLNLILRDGVLTGRYSDRPVAPFLPGHARLTAVEAEEMTEALTSILLGVR
jgi:hypothetical protein